jgi:L-lactate dehydrogenase
MKAGIVGIGSVGRAAALATLQRGSAQELITVNRNSRVSEAVALDMRYGAPLGPSTSISAGDYRQLAGAGIVVIAAGVNEKPAARLTARTSRDVCGCSSGTFKSCTM